MPIILNGTTGITTPGITNTGPFTFQGVVELPAGAVGAPSLTTTGDTNTGIYFPAADTIAFAEGGVEVARFDSSGNLGIGITSPAAGLQVANGNVRLTNGSAFTTGNALIREINAAAGSSNQFVTSSIGFRTDAFVDSGIITFSTASSASSPTERMRLDASGNLIVGQSSSTGSFRANGEASFRNTANTSGFDIGLLGGASEPSGFIYQRANSFIALGTNNTERARITAAGDLGIGTASPLDRLDVASGNANLRARVRNTTGSEATLIFQNSDTGTTLTDGLFVGIGADETGYLYHFENQPLVFGTNNTERARITSGGNLLVGTTSNATVNATSARTNVNGNLNVTGYTQTSLFQTGLGVPDTGDPSGWCRLGRIDTSQGGAVVHIRVYFHTGFNASVAQTGMADILFKTSNGSSSTAGSTGPFFGDVTTYSYGFAGIGIVRVVQNNTSQYDFFLFLGSYTNGSIYTVDVTSPTTWTQFGNLQTPSGNFIDSGIRNVAYA